MTVRVIACEDSAAQARRLGEEHGLDGLAFELWEPPVSVGLVYEGATTPWRWAQLPGLRYGCPLEPFGDCDTCAGRLARVYPWLVTSERRQP